MSNTQMSPSAYKQNIAWLEPKTDAEREYLADVADDMFTYHSWTVEQIKSGQAIRDALKAAFIAIVENAPASPDRTTALRKLREARMDANSAITHGGKY